jgi:energy-coupling factor transport system substrate-specific component
MIAVVATLAALAALGRDAFVALPDVKPITAMTLVVGYALGPLPGFTVGAVGMFASNILLGQGPYTPWQMVAWGLVGLFGAALGSLTDRRLSRVGLALACAASALAAKEIMNVYVWTLGGTYTTPALLARVAEGLPFDLTDTVASFLFGLAFAPELARLLARVRARMEISWSREAQPAPAASPAPAAPAPVGSAKTLLGRGAGLVVLALALGALGAAAGHGVGTARASPAVEARANLGPELSYLQSAQNGDGGFGAARGERSSELYSAWAAMGLAAGGRDPLAVARGGHSVLNALGREASTLESAGDIERTILALYACGVPDHSLGNLDLEAKLMAARHADGSFAGQVNLTAFGLFALRAEGHSPREPLVQAAGAWIARQEDSDGGFSFAARGSGSEVDDTAAAVEAMVAAGRRTHAVLGRAVSYIAHAQNPDGGFPQQPGGESNAQSTAWAIQGLVAAGSDVETLRRRGSRSPLAYLESLVAPGGSVRYSRTSAQTPVWVTAQALTALARKPFPIAPVHVHGAGASSGSYFAGPTGQAEGLPGRAFATRSGDRFGTLPWGPRSGADRYMSAREAAALEGILGTVARSLAVVGRGALRGIGVAVPSA